jgi:malate permease and related proteins
MSILIEVMLPLVLVIVCGFSLQKKSNLHLKSLSSTVMYIFLPCLTFKSLYEKEFDRSIWVTIIVYFILLFTLWLLVLIYSQLFKRDEIDKGAFFLSTIFINVGNYGSPVVLFALGEKAFQIAITIYVFQTIVLNSLGIILINKSKDKWLEAILSIFKLPLTYAVLLVVILKYFDLQLTTSLFEVVALLANGALPTIMLILGAQIAKFSF